MCDAEIDFSVEAMEMSHHERETAPPTTPSNQTIPGDMPPVIDLEAGHIPGGVGQALKVKAAAEALLTAMSGLPAPLIHGVRDVIRFCNGKPQPLFAALLRERREIAGMSRLELAQKTGLSPSTVKFIEKRRTNPTRTTLLHLLRVTELGLTWDDMPKWMMRPITESAR